MPNGNGNGTGVTWKWLVGILVALLLSLGGYHLDGMDKRSLANEQHAVESDKRISALDVELQQEKVRNFVQWEAIRRDMDEMKAIQRRIEERLNAMARGGSRF